MRKIAYIDDEQGNCLLFKMTLSGFGEIDTFTSPRAALEIMKSHSYDVIVSDFRMDEMDGLTFLKSIQEQTKDSIKFILTGYPDPEAFKDAQNSGLVSAIFYKPFDPDKFVESVKNIEKLREIIYEDSASNHNSGTKTGQPQILDDLSLERKFNKCLIGINDVGVAERELLFEKSALNEHSADLFSYMALKEKGGNFKAFRSLLDLAYHKQLSFSEFRKLVEGIEHSDENES